MQFTEETANPPEVPYNCQHYSTAQSTQVEGYTAPSSCTVPFRLSVKWPWLRECPFGLELEPIVIYPNHPVAKVSCTW